MVGPAYNQNKAQEYMRTTQCYSQNRDTFNRLKRPNRAQMHGTPESFCSHARALQVMTC